jgi:hypothetical protein
LTLQPRGAGHKLVETLVDLVLFSTTDAEPYYRDYILIRELTDYVGFQKDRSEFYGFTNRNSSQSIDDFLVQLKANEPRLDCSRRWYLKTPASADDSWGRAGPQLATFRAKYKSALPHFRETEFVAAGKSYTHAYSFSREIHFSPHETSSGFSRDDLRLNGDRCVILALSIVSRCADMLGVAEDPAIKQIAAVTTLNPETVRIVDQARKPIGAVGDIVHAHGSLGRIVDTNKSKYGLMSYEIEYLGTPPLPEIRRDWFAGFEITVAARKAELVARVSAELGVEVPVSVIEEFLDQAALEVWQALIRGAPLDVRRFGGFRNPPRE